MHCVDCGVAESSDSDAILVLKRQSHEIFDLWFFHKSTTLRPLINTSWIRTRIEVNPDPQPCFGGCIILKSQSHEIFYLWFFSYINYP
jgi:hypothetical protein